ncbi:MAG: S8 family serine peptidase [Rikenellaceae bacterium]|nr:S8 family serine peptidase [Rikenellaceae bacterium]
MGWAQPLQPAAAPAPEPGWHLKSFDTESVYGAEVTQAYEYLAGRKPLRTVTVALIGPGIDVEHEALAGSIWTNPREEANGLDNDQNGYPGDLHGWNFLGYGIDGVLERVCRFGDREFLRLTEKYGTLLSNGTEFYRYDPHAGKFLPVPASEDREEYDYYRYVVLPESPLGKSHQGGLIMHYVRANLLDEFDRQLKERFPDQKIGTAEFNSLADPENDDELRQMGIVFTGIAFQFAPSGDWEEVKHTLREVQPAMMEESYRTEWERMPRNEREWIGDDPLDIDQKGYGNSELLSENAGEGTLYAGIIGAARDNETGMKGIADSVRIMTLRIEADAAGEPYLKDMALAIRYAVDNGADIIQFNPSNTLYPPGQGL